jgi:hypothetical protein
METRQQVLYELLGSTSLLYRHAPSYTLFHESTRKNPSENDLVRWRNEFLCRHRIKARFFDTSVRLSSKKPRIADEDEVTPLLRLKDLRSKLPRNPEIVPCVTSDEEHRNKLLEEVRRAMFPNNPALPITTTKLDRTYATDFLQTCGPFPRQQIATRGRLLAAERTNAAPEYLAPFYSDVLMWGLSDKKREASFSEKQSELHLQAREHGNCLVSFRCPCCQTTRCLIHSTGDMLSKLCLSTLDLPQERGRVHPTNREGKRVTRHEVQIGERILQISECTPWETGIGYFLIRTGNFCTVVTVESLKDCTFRVKLGNRIDLRSLSPSCSSFRPRNVATHPRYGNSFTDPLVAVVSKVDGSMSANVVHRGISEPVRHTIGNLQNIELLEFSNSHPMILHASATSYVRPALVNNFVTKRPMLGHGSSLYTIDLRSNQAAFQWSPSAAEFVTESVHSISGIVSDFNSDHSMFIASTSAARCWEVDSRMPYKAMNSWSLPELCNSMGINAHTSDLHGNGMLLYQPRNEYKDGVSRPFLSVEKSLGAFGMCVYQKPLVCAFMETQSLEVSGCPELTGVSVARSSIFPLPDVSDKVFTCGIASFRDDISCILTSTQRSLLDYTNDPSMALSVITMTSNGDLYSSMLLECNDQENPQGAPLQFSGSFRRLPLDGLVDKSKNPKSLVRQGVGGFKLRSFLGVDSTIPSSKLKTTIVETRSDCDPFNSIPLNEIRHDGASASNVCGINEAETENNETDGIPNNPGVMSNANAGTTARSILFDIAIQDIQVSDDVMQPLASSTGQQELVGLGNRLWTQPTPNIELSSADF